MEEQNCIHKDTLSSPGVPCQADNYIVICRDNNVILNSI